MAAKQKTFEFLIASTLLAIACLLVQPSAASCNIVKPKPHYDFKSCKISKPHYGVSEKILVLELVQINVESRETLGQNSVWLRRLRLVPGMMYFRARYFEPTNGEFIQQDPEEYVDGASMYRGYFVPDGTDPFGKQRKPGQAVCQGKPRGVRFIPGRGRFQAWNLELFAPKDRWSRLGSTMTGNFSTSSKFFVDPKCKCCCKSIGWIQVKQETFNYGADRTGVNYEFNGKYHTPVLSHGPNSKPLIDGGVPYKHQREDPCQPFTNFSFDDAPNAPEWHLGITRFRLFSLKQDFELCVVCLSGNEGITTNRIVTPTTSTIQITNVTTYGCLKWGHEIYYDRRKGKYVYMRYINGQIERGGPGIKVLPGKPFAPAPPSPFWKKGILNGWTGG